MIPQPGMLARDYRHRSAAYFGETNETVLKKTWRL